MTINYQDAFLSVVRKEKVSVTIFLTNGYQIRCTIRAYDNYVLMVDVDDKQQMIYKHAISTIAPLKPVRVNYGAKPKTAVEASAAPESAETLEVNK